MDSQPLFWKRMVIAREPGGPIVGCVGVEASLFNPVSGAVLRSGGEVTNVIDTAVESPHAAAEVPSAPTRRVRARGTCGQMVERSSATWSHEE